MGEIASIFEKFRPTPGPLPAYSQLPGVLKLLILKNKKAFTPELPDFAPSRLRACERVCGSACERACAPAHAHVRGEKYREFGSSS